MATRNCEQLRQRLELLPVGPCIVDATHPARHLFTYVSYCTQKTFFFRGTCWFSGNSNPEQISLNHFTNFIQQQNIYVFIGKLLVIMPLLLQDNLTCTFPAVKIDWMSSADDIGYGTKINDHTCLKHSSRTIGVRRSRFTCRECMSHVPAIS